MLPYVGSGCRIIFFRSLEVDHDPEHDGVRRIRTRLTRGSSAVRSENRDPPVF